MNKILILSDSFNGYGAEYMLKWLGNSLLKSGNNVTFCSIFDNVRDAYILPKADYYQIQLPNRQYNLRYFIIGIRFLKNICHKNQYDYVVTFHTNPFLMALLARPFSGYRLIHSERDNPFARNTIPSRLKSWLYRYADKVVFQTEGAKSYFDAKTQKKSVIIPNPIAIPSLSWKGGIKKTIVSVGRLDIHFKRQDLLLEAFAEIAGDFPDYKVVFYGDGKDRQLLEKMADSLGIKDRVVFYGKVFNVTERLAEDGIFVMTSDSEGMPNALMEAMALGMPVISTDCEPGGARALIDSGVNGFVISRGSKEELIAKLRDLLNDSQLCIKIGAKARDKMRLYAPEQIAKMWLNIL